jgi:hypothetical protein
LSLGVWNVDAMLRAMTLKQLEMWQAYEALEPFGERRADYRAASICQYVFNMAVAVKDRRPLKDFLLEAEEEVVKPKQTWQEQELIMKMWAGTAGPVLPIDES